MTPAERPAAQMIEQVEPSDYRTMLSRLSEARARQVHTSGLLRGAVLSRLVWDRPFAALAAVEACATLPCATTRLLERLATGDSLPYAELAQDSNLTRLLSLSRVFRERALSDTRVASLMVEYDKARTAFRVAHYQLHAVKRRAAVTANPAPDVERTV